MAKKILLMDDSPLMLDVAKDALEAAGYQVELASSIEALEERAENGELALILMDVQMPELFGDDVAMVLRSVRGVSAPIYLLSNLSPDELAERAAEAGLDGYICKRDGIEVVVEKVKEILG